MSRSVLSECDIFSPTEGSTNSEQSGWIQKPHKNWINDCPWLEVIKAGKTDNPEKRRRVEFFLIRVFLFLILALVKSFTFIEWEEDKKNKSEVVLPSCAD